VKIAREDPPDLIFLDEVEAEQGYQVAASLKNDFQVASIPLVVSISREDARQEQPMGADDFLARPYSFQHLVTKFDEYLDRN
jgi:DNA-binding response OmpR family regulator